MTHTEPHPLRGNTVEITGGLLQGQAMYVVDWWDRITGESWMGCVGSPECFDFALRSAVERAPIDNEAVYGLIGPASKIIHASYLPNDAAKGERCTVID